MSTGSRRQSRGGSSDPVVNLFWLMIVILGVVLALPALILGVVLQRVMRGHKWSFPLWFLLTIASAGLLFHLYTHGLNHMITIQLADYVVAVKYHQANIEKWNLGHLWSETWPVWVRTLVVSPMIALCREVEESIRGGVDASSMLSRREHQRTRRIERSKRSARRRTRRPERVPDAVKGLMVMGIPIDDRETE